MRGSINLENGFSQPEPAVNFVREFNTNWSGILLNYGAIDGCPPLGGDPERGTCLAVSSDRNAAGTNKPCKTFALGTAPANCTNRWTQADAYAAHFAIGNRRVIPQIYRVGGDAAAQWKQMSLYGIARGQKRIVFPAPLTQALRDTSQEGPQYDAITGWQKLARTLNTGRNAARTRQSRISYNTVVAPSW